MAKAHFPSQDSKPSTEPRDPDLPAESPEIPGRQFDVRNASSVVLEEILARADEGPYEHWGINE